MSVVSGTIGSRSPVLEMASNEAARHLISKQFDSSSRRQKQVMNLSVVIPAYNEAHRIADTLQQVLAFCESELSDWEVIVVDDGSSDDTERKVRDFERVRYIRNDENRGKGFSVRRGVMEARCDTVMFTDADLSAPIREARRLLAAIDRGADVAIASRRFDVTTTVDRTPWRRLLAFSFRLLVRLLVIRGIEDTQCGFKMFRREAARTIFRKQRLDGWGFDVELLYIARRHRYRIDEVPVSWTESSESRLKWHTPLSMVLDLLHIRLNGLLGRYG